MLVILCLLASCILKKQSKQQTKQYLIMLKSRKYLVHAFIVCIISTVVLAKGNNENNNCLSTSTSDVQFFICNFCKNNILNYISNQDNENLTTEMCSSSNMMDNSTIGEKIQLISSTIVTS